MLTDRGTEYCGAREHHEYELYLAVENIDHSGTKARHPQSNGICERFHKTLQDEFYSTAFRKTLYTSLEPLQADLDLWWKTTSIAVRITANTALAKLRCRPSWTPGSSPGIRFWIGSVRPLWPLPDDLACQIKFRLLTV